MYIQSDMYNDIVTCTSVRIVKCTGMYKHSDMYKDIVTCTGIFVCCDMYKHNSTIQCTVYHTPTPFDVHYDFIIR